MSRLRITEIFFSLQGEGRTSGCPTVFVRLTGCPLRCGYCDTEYAFSGGEWMEISGILQQVAGFDVNHVCVTGGEPLAQKACGELLTALCDQGYQVSLETSGALDISGVDTRVSRVVDIKTPASGEAQRNLSANLERLTAHDQIKFVICDEEDYLWSRAQLETKRLAARCEVLFSPAQGRLEPTLLADWILRDRLPVRLQLQLHKLLWGDQPGR
jgi:7-carboxy-7-deazaguanine synthase